MRKARSRNFILIVCGVLITFLLGIVIARGIVNFVDDVDSKDKEEELKRNILSSSSKIKLYGRGNFIDSTPSVDKTMISDYNVRLTNKDDEVVYSLSFCNMNNEDLKFEHLIVEAISCIDDLGNDDCSNVEIKNYVTKKKKRLYEGDSVSANSCIDVVIDAKYIGDNPVVTDVSISRVVLELNELKR